MTKTNSLFSVFIDAMKIMRCYRLGFNSRGVHLDFCSCALSYEIRVDTKATCVGICVPALLDSLYIDLGALIPKPKSTEYRV